MGFTIPFCLDSDQTDQKTPPHSHGNIEWFLQRCGTEISIVAGVAAVYRREIQWRIVADFHFRYSIKRADLHYEKLNVSFSNSVEQLESKHSFFRQNTKFSEDLVAVTVTNIRTSGLRKFKLGIFENLGWERDLTILVKEEKILCHSLIVGLNSAVFREMLKNKSHPLEITLDETTSADDVRELLHHLYNTGEEIDEHNVKLLLELGKKYQLTQLLERCQRSLDSQMNELCSSVEKKKNERNDFYPDDPHCPDELKTTAEKSSILRTFLLSWKYGLEPLKEKCIQVVFSNKLENSYSAKRRKEILKERFYLEMDDATKLQMWEFLNERLDN